MKSVAKFIGTIGAILALIAVAIIVEPVLDGYEIEAAIAAHGLHLILLGGAAFGCFIIAAVLYKKE
jgi:hypothetical protein